ncbi:MAG TPA: phosphotransferase, partial [Ilumatobacteraceae bacterium]
MTPEGLTDAWLSSVLNSDVHVRDTRRIGDGLVGMNIRLELESDGSVPGSLIAKLPSPDPTSRATGIALRNYEREVYFYLELAPTVDIRVARCYHAEWEFATGDFIILMEDLTPARQGNQLTGCDADQARTAVLELAKLHGPRWGDPTLADIEWLSRRGESDGHQLGALWAMFLPGFFDTYDRYLSVDARAVIERFGAAIVGWANHRDPPNTVTHGDYRLDNLMFGTAEGGPPIAAVDWQTPGHGLGITDVSYFLGAGVVPEERRRLERDLVDQYGEALADYGVPVDAEGMWQQYRREA